MTITGIKCANCGDIVYSRARHDFRWCSCESCAIDGGQRDYFKVTGNVNEYKFVDLELNVTLEKLYNDWNKSIDKLGLIKGDDDEK
jgi:hypothetical protein